MNTSAKTKEKDFTEKLLLKYENDPAGYQLQALILIGLLSPIISVLSICGFYILNQKSALKTKEINFAVGMWLLIYLLNSAVSILLLNAPSISTGPSFYLQLLAIYPYFQIVNYFFIGLVLINAYRFHTGKEILRPRLMSINLNYTLILNYLTKGQLNKGEKNV